MLNCVSSRPDSSFNLYALGIDLRRLEFRGILESLVRFLRIRIFLSDLNKISYTQERRLVDSPCVELDNLIMKVEKGGAKNVQNLFNLH